jgi:hypothetical protein
MDYRAAFFAALDTIHAEGRCRVFALLKRHLTWHHVEAAPRAGPGSLLCLDVMIGKPDMAQGGWAQRGIIVPQTRSLP